MRKYLLLIFAFVFSVTCSFADNPVEELDEKYYLLLQKGARLEKEGEYDDAYEVYESAYKKYKNVQPLLCIANLQTRVGNYAEARRCLKKIPTKKLPVSGQAEVALLLGKIYAQDGDMANAANEFSNSLKLVPEKSSAKIRSAMVKLIMGMPYSAEEMLAKEEFSKANGYFFEDYRMCFAIDMYTGNFGRAFKTCKKIGKANIDNNPKSSFFELLINQPAVLFVSFLPLLLSRYLAIFYYILLFIALGLSASALAKKTTIWHIAVFVIGGVTLLTIAQNYCINKVYVSILNGNGYIYDGIWIVPRMIIASHLVALSLFLIFPCFKLVKENMRPVSYELLGIWLFCFFFGVFVLAFQSNLNILPKLIYMAIGIVFSILSALIMPFSKLLLYKISEKTGLSFISDVGSSDVSNGNLRFSDVKILENKMWGFVNKGEIDSALELGKKVLTTEHKKNFPSFWLAMIFSQISNEEYENAAKSINEFYGIFQNTEYFESCQVYEALLKTEKGDFATAYKLINSISADRAKSMSGDEVAISLLVLGRYCLSRKDNVQAHVNFGKAVSCAKSILFKLIALTDVSELDSMVESKHSLQKWKTQVMDMHGTGKCVSYLNTINSMVAYSENRVQEADELAKKCLDNKIPNSKSVAWYGHLLCLKGKTNEAEELLPRMKAGSYTAECLMTEVTSN